MTVAASAMDGQPEVRFRYLAEVRKGSRAPSSVDARPDAQKVPYLTVEYLRGDSVEPDLVPLDPSLLLASDESILLLWDGSNAGEFLNSRKGAVSSTLALVTPRFVDREFFYWACKSQEQRLRAETAGTSIPHVNGEVLADMRIRLPSPDRQRAIADYLNRETRRLDALVVMKERMLALLAEKRQALVTHAITRGVGPAASLRAPDIPWLDRIPAHWEIRKLGHIASTGSGATPDRDNAEYWTDGTVPWFSGSAVNQHEIKKAENLVTRKALHECNLPRVGRGSVLLAVTGQGRTRGQAVVSSIDGTISQHLAYISPDRSKLDSWFLRWTLSSCYPFLRSISEDASGVGGALTCENLSDIRVPVPPLGEQRAIVSRITKQVAKLDKLQAAGEKTIALLGERRSAVISAAVSGQIDAECAA